MSTEKTCDNCKWDRPTRRLTTLKNGRDCMDWQPKDTTMADIDWLALAKDAMTIHRFVIGEKERAVVAEAEAISRAGAPPLVEQPPELPEGWELVGTEMQLPRKGQMYITEYQHSPVEAVRDFSHEEYYIVRRKEQPPDMPDGWELAEPKKRLPKEGEWFRSIIDGRPIQASHDYEDDVHWILRRKAPAKDVPRRIVTTNDTIELERTCGGVIRVCDSYHAMYATPDEARKLAAALIATADEIEQGAKE